MSQLNKVQAAIFEKHGVHLQHKTMYQVGAILLLSLAFIVFQLLKPIPVEYQYDSSVDPVANSN